MFRLVLCLILLPGSALAGGWRQEEADKKWKAADNCTKESFVYYPDYTPQHVKARDAYVRKCLMERKLPPRNGVSR